MAQFPFQIRQLPTALQDFASEMENIVDQVFNNGCSSGSCNESQCESNGESQYRPSVDVYESEAEYHLLVDIPGVALENLKLEVIEDRLHVQGTRGVVSLGDGVVMHRGETPQGKFSRSVRLPKQVDVERIGAALKNGVLHVTVPKVPKPTSRQIEIKSVS
ncbi:MAG: Hsp20/alpha crystallin family protein [Pirellula sp.]|jgi:HSP20 family protein